MFSTVILVVGICGELGAEDLKHRQLTPLLPFATQKYIAAGVMEKWENNGYFNNSYYFQDSAVMDNRLQQMEVDCPQLIDVRKFPAEEDCRKYWYQGYQYSRYLEQQLNTKLFITPQYQQQLETTLADTQWRMKFWDLVVTVSGERWPSVKGRRLQLQQIREYVGRKAYDADDWPDPLPPSGYFQEWAEPVYQPG